MRFPVISTISPIASPSRWRSSGSMRANARPTSLPRASVTRSLSVSASSLDTPDLQDPVGAGHLHLLPREAPRQKHLLLVFLVPFLGGDNQEVILDLEAHVAHPDPGHLGHDKGVAPLLEDIDRGLPDLVDHRPPRVLVAADVPEGLDLDPLAPEADLDREAVDPLELPPGAGPTDLTGLRELAPRLRQLPQLFHQAAETHQDPAEPCPD